jgi:hypothetical protein
MRNAVDVTLLVSKSGMVMQASGKSARHVTTAKSKKKQVAREEYLSQADMCLLYEPR